MPDSTTEAFGALNDYVTWRSGGTPSKDNTKYWTGSIPWLTPKDMKSFDIDKTSDYLTDRGVRAGSTLAPATATYIVVRGMILAHTFPVSQMSEAAAFNQDVKAVLPDARLLPRYLAYWFQGHAANFLRLVGESTHGTKKLDMMDLRAFPMNPPPIAEQARIVEILTALDDQIRFSERIIDKLRTTSIALRSNLYCDASGANWTSTWPLTPLGTVVAGIDSGKSPDCPDVPASAREWGVLKVSAVGRDHFRPLENKVIPSRIHVDPRWEVRSGDILMTRANTPDLVGMVCLADRPFESRLALSDKTWRINPGKHLDSLFLVEALRATPSRRYIQNVATGTSGSMKNFSQLALLKMLVPVPDLNTQRRSAGYLKELTARIDAEEEAVTKLRAVKAGALSDLLTGRADVPEGAPS